MAEPDEDGKKQKQIENVTKQNFHTYRLETDVLSLSCNPIQNGERGQWPYVDNDSDGRSVNDP